MTRRLSDKACTRWEAARWAARSEPGRAQPRLEPRFLTCKEHLRVWHFHSREPPDTSGLRTRRFLPTASASPKSCEQSHGHRGASARKAHHRREGLMVSEAQAPEAGALRVSGGALGGGDVLGRRRQDSEDRCWWQRVVASQVTIRRPGRAHVRMSRYSSGHPRLKTSLVLKVSPVSSF